MASGAEINSRSRNLSRISLFIMRIGSPSETSPSIMLELVCTSANASNTEISKVKSHLKSGLWLVGLGLVDFV